MPNLSIDLSSTILHSLTFVAVRLMLVDCPLLHYSILLKERVVVFVLHSIPLSLSLLTPILIPMIMIVHHPTTPSLPSNGCSTYHFGAWATIVVVLRLLGVVVGF